MHSWLIDMISEKETIRFSKFLSLVLRHQPGSIGIVLDESGWTDLNDLIARANENGVLLSPAIVKHIVETSPKKRFALNESSDKIRANQGHSVEVDLGYKPQIPPSVLYHGTSTKVIDEIMKSGLQKRSRHQVHLSADFETAVKVGQRHGKPFVFQVMSGVMSSEGYEFYLSDNGVWLTDNVPVKFLRSTLVR